jgi:small subunit ribosomal protein S20
LPKSPIGCIISGVGQELIGGFPLANTHAAEKAIRQSARRQVRNRVIRTTTRTQIKKATTVIAAGDTAAAEKATLEALSALDRAAQKGIIKKNNAARRKSRLMKKLNDLRAAKK